MSAQKITIHGFLNEFKRRHEQMKDRPFCWVLGSGASVQSNIPTGGALANQWLKELQDLEDFEKLPTEEWATAENLGIPGFDYARAANFYPWIYQRRFNDYKEQGYAFLENVMDHAEPSFGYSVLAQIMASTPHKIAVTTNFDNLIADALSIYTRTFPLVCGHESLTGYIRPNLRRPLVAKIHRDLLLAPLSNPDEIAQLPGEWAVALTKIFDRFTPIVIGYGGNDGSLMGFLKTLAPVEGGIFWCHRESGEIDAKIHEVVEHHHGRLVPIAGFDELMLQLQEKLQLPFLLPQLQSVHDKRKADYQKQFEALADALRKPAENPAEEMARKPARKAAEAAVERLTKEKNWWAWQLKANAESDPDKQEAIYRAGLEDFPQSAELYCNFAVFMENVRKNYDEAGKLYEKALELSPADPLNISNWAWFLYTYKKDYDPAEKFFRKALELDAKNARTMTNFAVFMENVRKNYDEAGQLYQKASEIDPADPVYVGNWGWYLHKYKNDYDQAEKFYRKALELGANNVQNITNLAMFMETVRKNYDEAGQLYQKAVELDPASSMRVGNWAWFLHKYKKDYDQAEKFYRKALELDANNASTTSNFADFMENVRQNYAEARRLYLRLLELEPANKWVSDKYEEFCKAHPA